MKNFAGINFRGEPLSKDFTGIKKGEKSKFVRRNIRLRIQQGLFFEYFFFFFFFLA